MGGIIQTQSSSQFQVRLNRPTDGELQSDLSTPVGLSMAPTTSGSHPQDILPDTWGLWIDSNRRQHMALLVAEKN